jgi:hypothetical protein
MDETKSSKWPWQQHSASQEVRINTNNMDLAAAKGAKKDISIKFNVENGIFT